MLAQRGHWDDATREVVLDRVHNVPRYTYFDAHQRATLEALCARVVPQQHRPADRRIPIAPWIDQRCASRAAMAFSSTICRPMRWHGPGAWKGWTRSAQAQWGDAARFRTLDEAGQHRVLAEIRGGDPPGAVWRRLPARRWWVYVALRQITGVYYAHPYAWDEIGFGGPAYPRGYFALNFGAPEPWEAREAGPSNTERA